MTPLAAIHAGKAQLGLDDDTYRALLERITGKRSARDMTAIEQAAVVDEMRRQGFVSASRRGRAKTATGQYAPKLQALWIAAWNLGVVRNKDDAAMLAFVERQTGLSHTRFLQDAGDAMKAIEALKAWLGREATVDWSPVDTKLLHPATARFVNDPRYRVATAQWRKLWHAGKVGDGAAAPDYGAFQHHYARAITTLSGFQFYEDRHWIALMNALGVRIRVMGRRARKAA